MGLCSLVVGLSSDSVQTWFFENSTVSSMIPQPLESPRVFAVVHFSHYFTSQLSESKGTQQGISSLSVTQRILSRQQSRKPHWSLQSAISVTNFVPLLTQGGEWKREQKYICTGVTLFFSLSASHSETGPRTRSSPSPRHLFLEAWAGMGALRWFPLTHQDPADSLLCQSPLPEHTYSEWSWFPPPLHFSGFPFDKVWWSSFHSESQWLVQAVCLHSSVEATN